MVSTEASNGERRDDVCIYEGRKSSEKYRSKEESDRERRSIGLVCKI